MAEMTFSTPDFIILGLITLSILIGIVRGLIKESISVATWILAIYVAMRFSKKLSVHFVPVLKDQFISFLAAFFLIFVIVVFIGAIVNFIVGSFVRKTPFSPADKVLGSFFGLLRGIVFVTVLLLLAGLTPFPEESWWKQSYTVSRFEPLVLWLKDKLPEDVEKAFHFPNEPKKPSKTPGLINPLEKGKDQEKKVIQPEKAEKLEKQARREV